MIREIDLASYLPPFMQAYKEIIAALNTEDDEFTLVWNAKDQVLSNRFISTADEYGISRYEKMLGIYPSEEDTLESRRSRVQSKWFNTIPYTLRVLIQKLKILCGDTNFTLIHNFNEGYTLTLLTDLEMFGQVEALEDILQTILPLNIMPDIQNTFQLNVSGILNIAGGVAYADYFFITNDFQEEMVVSGNKNVAVGVTVAELITQGKEG